MKVFMYQITRIERIDSSLGLNDRLESRTVSQGMVDQLKARRAVGFNQKKIHDFI
jgi:DNA helicase TIP49 (TBP-interacting protein)